MPEQPVVEPQKPDWQAKTFSYYADSFEPLVMQTYQLNVNLPEESEIKEVASAILPEPQPASVKLLANDIYYYQNDLNGVVPLRLFNTEGNIAWQAHYTVFGATDSKKVYQSEQPLRLQGQYFDDESGLHYNRHHYYDAQCGLFISQDLIGLPGRLNVYQYSPNTSGWIDPEGLWKKHCNNGQFAKKPGRKKKKACNSAHGNSHNTDKPAEGYVLKDLDTGEILEYGETTLGKLCYTKAYLKANNAYMEFQVSRTKKEMHRQHVKILEYKAAHDGKRPRLNKSEY